MAKRRLSTLGSFAIVTLFALYLPILDCDETYNFWEPLHYLLFGWGFQTWEYDPRFALRSWLYIKLHHALLHPIKVFCSECNKSVLFYALRLLLGTATIYSSCRFREAVSDRFGPSLGHTVGLILLGGMGNYAAGVSFLPSSFSMVLGFWSAACWLTLESKKKTAIRDTWMRIILLNVLSFLLGWPFALLSAIPCAIHCLLSPNRLFYILFSIVTTSFVQLLALALDSAYYGALHLTCFNLLRYNVFPRDSQLGAHLYGTEPATFIFKNLFLNFNIVFVWALVLPFLGLWVSKSKKHITASKTMLYAFPFFLSLIFWMLISHKEERFFFPMYPYLVLSAALSIDAVYHWCSAKISTVSALFLYCGVFVTYFAFSTTRALALFTLYSAPQDIHGDLVDLSQHTNSEQAIGTVCYGDDWYRFPSSFFLPNSMNVAFFRTNESRSQLPLPFISTESVSNDFNEYNQVNPMQFQPIENCRFIISSKANDFNRTKWKLVRERYILNIDETPWYYRAFYIPYFSRHCITYSPYMLFERNVNTKR